MRVLKDLWRTLMPRGPKGEKRHADVIGNAIMIAKIATGDIEETVPLDDGKDPAAKALGKKGGAARVKSLTPKREAEMFMAKFTQLTSDG